MTLALTETTDLALIIPPTRRLNQEGEDVECDEGDQRRKTGRDTGIAHTVDALPSWRGTERSSLACALVEECCERCGRIT